MCFCLWALVTGTALGAFPSLAHAQSPDVLNRIKRLENEIETLNRAVYRGEKPPVTPAAPAETGAVATIEMRLGRLENDLRTLTGTVEQQSYDIQQAQQKILALETDTRMRLDAIESQLRTSVPPGTIPSQTGLTPQQPQAGGAESSTQSGLPATLQPDPALAAQQAGNVTGQETGVLAADAAGLYEQGFSQIKAEDYVGAEQTFSAFMQRYPTHALAPNALYWLGETYYVRKDYDRASRAFAEAYQKFPDGPKGADNLLKLGMALAGKGERDNACIALRQLAKAYPNGPQPVLDRGVREMTQLGCN